MQKNTGKTTPASFFMVKRQNSHLNGNCSANKLKYNIKSLKTDQQWEDIFQINHKILL